MIALRIARVDPKLRDLDPRARPCGYARGPHGAVGIRRLARPAEAV